MYKLKRKTVPKQMTEMNEMEWWMSLLIQIVVEVIILAPVLWIAGRLLAGKDKAKFTDAIWIVVLGVILGAVANYVFGILNIGGLVGWLIATLAVFIIWLALIKHFFDCGWLKAFAIAVLAVIILVVIVVILALIGFGIVTFLF
jgi:hypothetical protein